MHSGNSQSKQSLQAEQAHPVQQAVTAAQAQQPFKQSMPQSLQQSSGNLQQFSHFGTSHLQQSAEHSGSSHLQHSAHFGISHVQHSGAEQHSGAHSGLHSGIFKQSPLQQSEVHSGKEQVQQSPQQQSAAALACSEKVFRLATAGDAPPLNPGGIRSGEELDAAMASPPRL